MRTIILIVALTGCVVVAEDSTESRSSTTRSSGGETTVVVTRDADDTTESEQAPQGEENRARARSPELRDDRQDNVDDVRDRRLILEIARDWKRAVRDGNRRLEQQADRRLYAWLEREIAEDRLEVRESSGEVADSRAELRESERSGTRGEAADDRRDFDDDVRDREQAMRDLELTREIAGRLRAMRRDFDAGRATQLQYTQKAQQLDRLVAIATRELQRNRTEYQEDRIEHVED